MFTRITNLSPRGLKAVAITWIGIVWLGILFIIDIRIPFIVLATIALTLGIGLLTYTIYDAFK